jgi:hypothetical protein
MKVYITKSQSYHPLEVGCIYKNPDAALAHIQRLPGHQIFEADLLLTNPKPLTLAVLRKRSKDLAQRIISKNHKKFIK